MFAVRAYKKRLVFHVSLAGQFKRSPMRAGDLSTARAPWAARGRDGRDAYERPGD